jgi:hypothetical protein
MEIWEDRLYYQKHNGIAQCYFEHVSQGYGEAPGREADHSPPASTEVKE